MMGVSEFQQTLADSLLQGNTTAAGLIMLATVMLLILALSRRIYTGIVLSLPVTILFWMLDVIGTDMMIVLIITALLGLVLYSKLDIGIDWDPLEGRDRWGRRKTRLLNEE